MKPWVLTVVALLLGACNTTERAPASAAPPASGPARVEPAALVDRAHIDSVLRGMVDEGKAVGVSALIYEDGHEAYFGAFGHADREADRPMARDTIVQIYSMTKPVTGVALMSLHDAGHFALDDPLAQHLPEFAHTRVYAGQDAAGEPRFEPVRRPIQVYDILRHTAGIAATGDDSFVGRKFAAAGIDDHDTTLAQMSEAVAQVPLLAQPGTRWIYGVSVDLQARMAERLAGVPFAQLIRERVLDPLQMHDTAYVVPQDKRHRLAAMYRHADGRFDRVPDEQAFVLVERERARTPGGYGLTSTLDDYMRFGRMLLGDGTLDGVRLLAPGTVKRMATDALPDTVVDRSWLPSKGQVGFGIDFAVRHSPPADSSESSGAVGEFFWDGYANTLFWVDPANALVAVFFTQYIPPGDIDLHKRFRDAVYHHDPEASAAKRPPAAD